MWWHAPRAERIQRRDQVLIAETQSGRAQTSARVAQEPSADERKSQGHRLP